MAKRTEKEHIRNIGGFLFENILLKSFESDNENRPAPKPFYFWRNYEGREIDLVIEHSPRQYIPVEIYLGKSFPREKVRNYCAFFEKFKDTQFGILIYRGDVKEEKITGKPIYLIPWWLWF